MASFLYTAGLLDVLGAGNLGAASTFKLLLVSSSHQFVTNLTGELAVTNYARKAVTPTLAANNTSGSERVEVTIPDQTWTALGSGATIHGAVLVKDTGSDATSTLIAFFDVANTATNGGDVTLDFAATGGNIQISV
jgi:hypothetical protein